MSIFNHQAFWWRIHESRCQTADISHTGDISFSPLDFLLWKCFVPVLSTNDSAYAKRIDINLSKIPASGLLLKAPLRVIEQHWVMSWVYLGEAGKTGASHGANAEHRRPGMRLDASDKVMSCFDFTTPLFRIFWQVVTAAYKQKGFLLGFKSLRGRGWILNTNY